MALDDRAGRFRFLVRGRDTKFTVAFDAVGVAEAIRVLSTPVRGLRANAEAGAVGRHGLAAGAGAMLILGCRQLRSVLAECVGHYNADIALWGRRRHWRLTDRLLRAGWKHRATRSPGWAEP
jgi:hypothetical protein